MRLQRGLVFLGAALLVGACQDANRTPSTPPTDVAELAGGGFSQEGRNAIQEMMETASARTIRNTQDPGRLSETRIENLIRFGCVADRVSWHRTPGPDLFFII